jgi:hypothetical protein
MIFPGQVSHGWIGFLTVALGIGWATPSPGELRDAFETSDPTWKFVQSDGQARIISRTRDFRVARSGHASESIRLSTLGGSYAYLAYEIQPVMLIDELQASVWVRANRSGLQLAMRVVLPHTRDPRTGKNVSVLLRGSSNDQVDVWQQLTISNVRRQFEIKRPALVDQFGSQIDFREAYVDRILLNAHGGKGTTQLWIDDLELSGDISAEHVGASSIRPLSADDAARSNMAVLAAGRSSAGVQTVSRSESPSSVSGSQFLVNSRPMMPRVKRWYGEPLTAIKDLRFNAVWLDALPPPHVLAEAERLELWLIVPYSSGPDERLFHPRTVAWAMAPQTAASFMETRRELRSSLRSVRRPLLLPDSLSDLAEPDDMIWRLGRYDPSEGNRLAVGGSRPTWSEHRLNSAAIESTRRQVYMAAMSGARGFIFDGPLPFSANEASYREWKAIEQLQNELQLIEPWIAGGHGFESIRSSDDGWRIAAFPSARSRLILALESSPAIARSRPPLQLVDPGASPTHDVYRIAENAVTPLGHRRVAGGLGIDLPRPDDVNLLVVTQDSLTVNYLGRTIIESAQNSALGLSRRTP